MIKPLRHSQAHRWIQARADGVLSDEKAVRLDAHLQTCSSCQAYAAEFLALDSGLRSLFRDRRAAIVEKRLPSQPRALDSLYHKMRANMNHKQIIKLTSSLSFGILMVILGIGLSVILSMEIYGPQPGQQGTSPAVLPSREPTATTSPTPLPWTEAAPLTDAAQIAAILDSLAQKNAGAFQNGEWMHTWRQDLSETGMMPIYPSDEWTRLPAAGEACAPYLAIVKDGSQDGQPIQIRLDLPDGTIGDLTNLRQGQGEVEHYGPDNPVCQLSPETTAAGRLIPYIDPGGEPPLAKKPTKLVEAKAWYTGVDGRLAFVVTAAFEDQGETPEEYRQIYEETRHFDTQTGTLLREHIVMKWADGSLFGESLAGYQTEFLPALPEAVAQEFDWFETELKLEASLQTAQGPEAEQVRAELEKFRKSAGVSAGGLAASTPAPEASQIPLDDLSYSQAEPLTDLSQIRAILAALQERRNAKLSQPGWYLYGPAEPNPEDWIRNRYVLTHALDDGGCEDLIYYVKDGKILPQEIHLADGRWGLMGVVENGALSQGGTGQEACQPENMGIEYPANEFSTLQVLQEGTVDGDARAWVADIDGKKYFILNYDTRFDQSQPVVMDPDTRKLEPELRQQEWKYYDLEWGSRSGWAAVYYLENGKILGEAPAAGVVPSYEGTPLVITCYENLPAELAEVYEGTVAELDAYLGQINP